MGYVGGEPPPPPILPGGSGPAARPPGQRGEGSSLFSRIAKTIRRIFARSDPQDNVVPGRPPSLVRRPDAHLYIFAPKKPDNVEMAKNILNDIHDLADHPRDRRNLELKDKGYLIKEVDYSTNSIDRLFGPGTVLLIQRDMSSHQFYDKRGLQPFQFITINEDNDVIGEMERRVGFNPGDKIIGVISLKNPPPIS